MFFALLLLNVNVYAITDTKNERQTISNTSPIASFTSSFKNADYNTIKNQEYGIQCDNATISDLGVKSMEFVTKAKVAFSSSGRTPHNESVKVTCNTEGGYYDLLTSQNFYTTQCSYGQFKNSSMCVKKCKFRNTEFSKEETVNGRDFSELTSAKLYEMKPFEFALNPMTGNPIDYISGSFFVKFGDSVKIKCPSTHPPYNSDTRVASQANSDGSFVTRCLDTSTTDINKWSIEMACYNGFKSCKNSEITVTQENEQWNTFGQNFNVKGGQKMIDDGITPHGGRLELNCNKPWYNKTKFIAPKCNDGKWSSLEAYCKANECSVRNMMSLANEETTWKVGNILDDGVTKYYGQEYEFTCAEHNRFGNKAGKTFKCMFDDEDTRSVEKVNKDNSWLARYCTTSACRYDIFGFSYLSNGEHVISRSTTHIAGQESTGLRFQCHAYYTKNRCSSGSMQSSYHDYSVMNEWVWGIAGGPYWNDNECYGDQLIRNCNAYNGSYTYINFKDVDHTNAGDGFDDYTMGSDGGAWRISPYPSRFYYEWCSINGCWESNKHANDMGGSYRC